jgi:hypothetical protein
MFYIDTSNGKRLYRVGPRGFCLAWLLLATVSAFSQSLPRRFSPCYIHYDEFDGLPSNNVYFAYEDSDNYLWFSTDNGISRYDGTRFQNFSVADGLSDIEVFSIYEDVKHRVWFLTLSGIPSYYHNGTFHNPSNTPFLNHIKPGNFLSCAYEDHENNLYLGSKSGMLYKISPEDSVIDFKDAFETGTIYSVSQDKNGALEVWWSTHLLAIIRKDSIHYLRLMDPIFNYPPRICKLRDGRLLFGNGLKLIAFGENYVQESMEFESIANSGAILNVQEDRTGKIWVSTANGAYRWDPELRKWESFLVGKYVSSVVMDHEGGVWFTSHAGVYYTPNTMIVSNKALDDPGNMEITAMVASLDRTSVYTGSIEGNVSRFDVRTGEETAVFQVPKDEGKNEEINQLVPLPDGNLMVLSQNGTFRVGQAGWQMCTKTNIRRMISHPDLPDCICHTFGWTVMEVDSCDTWDGKMKYGGWRGDRTRCFDLAYTPEGKMLIAMANGVFEVDGENVRSLGNTENLAKTVRINTIEDGPDGTVWIGTAGRGLFRVNGNEIASVLDSESEINFSINCIEFSSTGTLYLGTNKGILRLRPVHGKWEPSWVGKEDGLGSTRINEVLLVGNTIWAATTTGTIVFEESLFDRKAVAPVSRINRLSVNGKATPVVKDLLLPYYQNAIGIGYVGTSFNSMGEVDYRYRMIGLDSNWVYTKRDFVEYAEINPGTYQFQIQAHTRKGGWSMEVARLGIVIDTPFWRTTWFWIALPSVFLSLVIFALLRSISNIKRKIAIEKRAIEAEQRLLLVQMNPHFIFNALNSIQGYFFMGDLDRFNTYLGDFSNLLRKTLEHSRSATVELGQEIKFVKDYLRMQAYRLNDKFEFEINVQKGLNPQQHQIPPMLLQPFLENAILHGITPAPYKGKISVSFTVEGGNLICRVEDNGIGREKSRSIQTQRGTEHKSQALDITKERIELLKKAKKARIDLVIEDLQNDQGAAMGTRVTLSMGLIY